MYMFRTFGRVAFYSENKGSISVTARPTDIIRMSDNRQAPEFNGYIAGDKTYDTTVKPVHDCDISLHRIGEEVVMEFFGEDNNRCHPLFLVDVTYDADGTARISMKRISSATPLSEFQIQNNVISA